MNKREAAEYLGCSIRQLERYTTENRIAARYEKGRTRPTPVYDEAELQRFKAEQERPTFSPSVERANEYLDTTSNRIATQNDTALSPLSQTSQFPPGATIEVLARLLESASTQATETKTPRRIDPREAGAKLLLTLPEAQALTGLSRSTLRSAIDAGDLKAQQIGRTWRIKREDLERWVKDL